MSKLTIKKLSKVYEDKKEYVKKIDIDVRENEFLVLVGPSGCGKSTTLRMIAGLETITSGEVLLDDKIINDIEAKNRDIAMVFQNYALYPHMTVFDNMAFSLKLKKIDKKEIENAVLETAKSLEIVDILKKKPSKLSGGQKQRVALGRAIIRHPKVFLMDEPLSNLDAKLRLNMRTEIVKLHKKLNTTFIYVTHDQIEAMTMGDRIAVMNDGKIMQIDTPENIYQKPKNLFVAEFIGSPKINTFRCKYKDHKLFSDICNLNMDCKGEDRELILAFRPEDILIVEEDEDFKARVEVIENLGSEKYIVLENDIIIKVPSHIQVDEEVKVKIKKEKIHFFDVETLDRVDVLKG
ncbi:MAG: sugar ABC transporter ATP-binding protein [Clostridiales bacterium]|nr:MAG: sugar ABC transporter ATP-binding protein [Clostridiales bacterium]